MKDDTDLLLRIRQDKMRRVKNDADVLLRIRRFFLFDLILNVHSTIFQLCGTGLPGLNQY